MNLRPAARKNLPVLVTGGAGYIGSHVCKALAALNYLPICYDNLSRGHVSAVKWGPFEKGDLFDTGNLTRVLQNYQIDSVLHFAAFAYVGESMTSPDMYYRNNVQGSLSLFSAMHESQVSKIVFSSSCATYGVPESLPILESSPQNPINPYGASKLMVERILLDYKKAFGLDSIALRYFNAAGADLDGEIGENHDPETHLIPLAIKAAQGKGPALKIFGNDYPTPDGTCQRDYIHVSDLADAHLRALQVMEKTRLHSSAFNLGTGKAFSVKEIIRTVEDVTGRPVPIQLAARRQGDPPVLFADASLAKKELNWVPLYSNLSQMIESATRWASVTNEGLS